MESKRHQSVAPRWGSGRSACIAAALTLVACSRGDTSSNREVTDKPAEPTVLDASFKVSNYELHMRCEGSGSPTVVYLHGLSHTGDGGEANGESAATLPHTIAPKYRVLCVRPGERRAEWERARAAERPFVGA